MKVEDKSGMVKEVQPMNNQTMYFSQKVLGNSLKKVVLVVENIGEITETM